MQFGTTYCHQGLPVAARLLDTSNQQPPLADEYLHHMAMVPMRAPCQTLKCPQVVYTGFKPWLSDQEVCHYCLAMVCTERWSSERKWDENPSKAGLSTDTILYVALLINTIYSLRYFGQG